VIQIFTLVCKKLKIKLEVLNEAQVDHEVDILVVDSDFIDDRFNILKRYTSLIGAISKEDLPFELANDFLIPLPFLPSSLQDILERQLKILDKKTSSKVYVKNISQPDDTTGQNINLNDKEKNKDEVAPAMEFLESLADNIADDIDQDTKQQDDESIITLQPITNDGGVLDEQEINNIKQMIDTQPKQEQKVTELEDYFKDPNHQQEENWQDLSSIIDQAIAEISTTDKLYEDIPEDMPIKLVLNQFELEQITPLLNILDQKIIDKLADGQKINIQLELGDEI
jgi:hypothetical protein